MKKAMRILTALLVIVMMAGTFALPASANCAVDSLGSYGQQTWAVYPVAEGKTPNVSDGVVSEGEYGEALATVLPGDYGSTISNWTPEGQKHLSELDLLEVAPERMTLYATYDEKYLYMALVVVKVRHYSQAPKLNEIWGTENWLLSLYFDAYAGDRNEGEPWTYSYALSERFCVCAGLTSIGGAPAEPLALIGDNCSYMMYSPWDPVEDCGATRNDDTQTTTYEFKAAWENILWYYEGLDQLPDTVPIITQYVLSDERYMDHVAPGYINALGSFRWATELDGELAGDAGIQVSDSTRVKHIPHLLKFMRSNNPDETEETTDVVTDETTESTTETPTETPTEAPTDPVTETPNEVPTETPTEAPTIPAEQSGCGSVMSFSAVALLSAAAAAVVLKKKD